MLLLLEVVVVGLMLVVIVVVAAGQRELHSRRRHFDAFRVGCHRGWARSVEMKSSAIIQAFQPAAQADAIRRKWHGTSIPPHAGALRIVACLAGAHDLIVDLVVAAVGCGVQRP